MWYLQWGYVMSAPNSYTNDLIRRLKEADAKRIECTAHAGPHSLFGEAAIALERHDGPLGEAKNAMRWNTCLRLRAFPVRLGTPLYKDGGYVTWTINGEFYGGSENECVDDAMRSSATVERSTEGV